MMLKTVKIKITFSLYCFYQSDLFPGNPVTFVFAFVQFCLDIEFYGRL